MYFFSLAEQMALKKQENKTVLYTPKGHEWQIFGHPRKKRPLNSVILDQGIKERILNDCLDFINNPAWYNDRGMSQKLPLNQTIIIFFVLQVSLTEEGIYSTARQVAGKVPSSRH